MMNEDPSQSQVLVMENLKSGRSRSRRGTEKEEIFYTEMTSNAIIVEELTDEEENFYSEITLNAIIVEKLVTLKAIA